MDRTKLLFLIAGSAIDRSPGNSSRGNKLSARPVFIACVTRETTPAGPEPRGFLHI